MPVLSPYHRLLKGLAHTLFEPGCALCLARLEAEEYALCTACYLDLPSINPACSICQLPMAAGTAAADESRLVCGQCLSKPPNFDRCICALPYQAPVDRMIAQFKYSSKMRHAPLLANLLARQLLRKDALQHLPDALVPVPLHWRRSQQRGFNQSAVLARLLRCQLRKDVAWPHGKALPIRARLAVRQRNTASQTTHSRPERQANIRGAFRIRSPQALPAYIVLLDDVITSGATVNELSRVLKQAGVQRVDVWAVARTPAT